MKIEEGKKYLTRDGRVVGPMHGRPGHKKKAYPWTDGFFTWDMGGSFFSPTDESKEDIVSEYQDPPAKPEPHKGLLTPAWYPKHELNKPREEKLAEMDANMGKSSTPPADPVWSCTCHPDDNPPVPCARKYALSDCRRAADPEWIPWAGGECPVHEEAYVEYKLSHTPATRKEKAASLVWGGALRHTGITAYRVLWSPSEEKPKRSGTVWVDVYDEKNGHIAAGVYEQKDQSEIGNMHNPLHRLASIKINWTEGQFDD